MQQISWIERASWPVMLNGGSMEVRDAPCLSPVTVTAFNMQMHTIGNFGLLQGRLALRH